MLRRNLLNIGLKDEASQVFNLSVFFLFLMVALINYLPENIVDPIPTPVFGFVFIAFSHSLISKHFKDMLQLHKKNGGLLYKKTKSLGVNAISLISIFSLSILLQLPEILDDYPQEALYQELYDEYFENFNKANDGFYNNDSIPSYEETSSELYINFKINLENVFIPALERNVVIISEFKNLKKIYTEENKESYEYINDLGLHADLFLKKFKLYENLLKMREDDFYELHDEEILEISNKMDEISNKWSDDF